MKRYLPSIKHYSWILLICVLVATAGGLFITKSKPMAFQATATLFVNAGAPGTTYPGGSTSTDSLGEATNYAAMIITRSFMENVLKADPTIQSLGYTADDLLANTLTTPSTTVPSIVVATTAKKPSDAILLVNDIANTFQASITAQNQQDLANKRQELQTQLTTYQNLVKAEETQLLQIPSTDPRYPIISSDRAANLTLIQTAQTTLLSLPSTVTGDVTVIQSATARDVVPTTKTTTILAITGGVGLLVGILVMLLVISLDNRLRTDEEVKEKLGLSYLGSLSRDRKIAKDPTSALSFAAHEFADIGASLGFIDLLPNQRTSSQSVTLLITSAKAAEGKTSVAAGLAATMARSGYYVALVDGNLKQPETHLALKVNPTGTGLSGFLRSKGGVNEAVVHVNIPNLWLVPGGAPMENASLLLGQKLPALLTMLRQKVNIIIIDGPALLNGADASVLASMVDGVIMVVDIRNSKMPLLLRATEVISSWGRVRVGVILNNLPRRQSNQYYASVLPESKRPHKEMPIQQVAWNTPNTGGTPPALEAHLAVEAHPTLKAPSIEQRSLFSYPWSLVGLDPQTPIDARGRDFKK